MLESEGIPTVTLTTDEFAELVQLEAEQRGLPELRRVIVPHPIGGLREPAVLEKVRPAVPAVIEGLTGQP